MSYNTRLLSNKQIQHLIKNKSFMMNVYTEHKTEVLPHTPDLQKWNFTLFLLLNFLKGLMMFRSDDWKGLERCQKSAVHETILHLFGKLGDGKTLRQQCLLHTVQLVQTDSCLLTVTHAEQ